MGGVHQAEQPAQLLRGLEIYNRQYWFRVLDCLYDDYPGLRAILVKNPEARRQLEKQNPGLVAARDQAVVELRR